MSTSILGAMSWRGEQTEEGHRTYYIKFKIAASDVNDGPLTALLTPGLPTYGVPWIGFGNDVDPWAFCRWDVKIEPEAPEPQPNQYWFLTYTFSSKPVGRKCKDFKFDDPLLEPARVSGSFVKYVEEKQHDMFGNAIVNSAFEQFEGPEVEFDANRPQVRIEQNVATPYQAYQLPGTMVDTVNVSTLWGVPPRCVKLSDATWERQFYGDCYVYYKRMLTFDIRYPELIPGFGTGAPLGIIGGFDRVLTDHGKKCIRGHWQTKKTSGTGTAGIYGHYIQDPLANPHNPADYIRFKDFHGENADVILNGFGYPTGGAGSASETQIGKIFVEYYPESDFTQLFIPLTF